MAAVALLVLNRLNVRAIAPYVLVGIALWVFVLKSGVHATLAGVVLAFAIPMNRPEGAGEGSSTLERLEHRLAPWVAYAIMPLFAFANARVSLKGLSVESFLAPLPLRILLALFLRKQFRVFAAVSLTVKARCARLPQRATCTQIYGVACLAAISFTMSLFIGTLAFEGQAEATGVRLGVLAASVMSALLRYGLLRCARATRAAASVVSDLGCVAPPLGH